MFDMKKQNLTPKAMSTSQQQLFFGWVTFITRILRKRVPDWC